MRKSETNSIIDEGQRDWEELSSRAQIILTESSRERLNGAIENPDQGRNYHLTNAHGIGFGNESVDGVNYKVGGKVYVLTDDDRVYSYSSEERFSFTPVPIKDPTIVEAVKGQRDENDAIRWVRAERARKLADGNPVQEEIYRRHLDYSKGVVQSLSRQEGTFFAAGENAWFTFYLCLTDGQKKILAVRKDAPDQKGELIDVEEFGYTGDEEELDMYPCRKHERSENKAARPYCSSGSIWYSDDVSGNTYYVNREEYVVAGNGSVYKKEDYEHEVEVTDPAILLSIKAQIKEDGEIQAAREALATKESHGDSTALMILSWHMEFNSGVIDSEPLEKNGIKFYQVGRNASHSFYLGIKDGKMYKYATDGGYWNEETDEYTPDDSEAYEVDPNNVGYMGHF